LWTIYKKVLQKKNMPRIPSEIISILIIGNILHMMRLTLLILALTILIYKYIIGYFTAYSSTHDMTF
jgi:hypothetical protein